MDELEIRDKYENGLALTTDATFDYLGAAVVAIQINGLDSMVLSVEQATRLRDWLTEWLNASP